MIELRNINKSFGDKILFKDFNIKIDEGESVAIIGRSGSGKSTLLNIISLIEAPDSGEVLWNEKACKVNSKNSESIIRNEIAYLFQNYALIDNEDVYHNVLVACRYNKKIKDEKEAIRGALKEVGLIGMENRKIFSLSGGEQQRVALARVLVKPCSVIFADEPTGNLDDENSDKVMDILFDLNHKGKTIIVVTHDNRYLNRFNRIIKID